jgi:hypothetical protein
MTDGTPATGSGSALRIVAATAAFALVHSLLASHRAKQAAQRVAGDRARDGWYRAFYNAQAVVTTAALATYARRLPDRTLYEVHGALRVLMRAGQLAGLALAAQALREVGVLRFAVGATAGPDTRAAGAPAGAIEGQGPAVDASGESVRVGAAFALSRHPLNLAPLPILWLHPRMTANLAAFSAVTTLHLVAGSWHEERRLAASYGDAYDAYRRSGVPFLLPG